MTNRPSRSAARTSRAGRGNSPAPALAWTTGTTRLGRVLIAATPAGLCALAFGRSDAVLLRELRRDFPGATRAPAGAKTRGEFTRWRRALDEYLAGRRPTLDLPLDLQGTAFQLRVWRALCRVPRGQTRSYADVARDIGRPGAARAVARACAANRLAVAVPCHRVVRGDGDLSGYRWGVARKRALLELESRAAG
jgi:AraC family transcriptional regulator of adaptative response/methylated-DNA-[protein]-cysteine methyltransferase